ncbi:MAG: clostripain-related cysteine peptidase [Candidatus Wallbacteria bacterium]|nr:clostripain-related cysteine peptidase [Candidatus Wallbacteria bacterium]
MRNFLSVGFVFLIFIYLVHAAPATPGNSLQNVKGTVNLKSRSIHDQIAKLETASEITAEESQTKPWSIMIYASLDAEDWLERRMLKEITEIAGFGNCNGQIHIVAQVDFLGSQTDRTTTRYYITKDALNVRCRENNINSNLNTGDPNNFQSFLEWAASYPANHKMLYIMGHGSGWIPSKGPGSIRGSQKSFGIDYTSQDSLTMAEVSAVFEQVLGGDKLDIIAFRACLMGQVEAAVQLSKYFNYMVASETKQVIAEPNTCDVFLDVSLDPFVFNILSNDPNSQPLKTAKAVYTSILTTNVKGNIANEDFEMSCLDLTKIRAVIPDMETLSDLLVNDMGTADKSSIIAALTAARQKTHSFEGILGNESVDLGLFLSNLAAELNQASLQDTQLADQVRTIVDSCLNNIQDATLDRSNPGNGKGTFSVSIFMPPDDATIRQFINSLENIYGQLEFGRLTGWDKVIHKYLGLQ